MRRRLRAVATSKAGSRVRCVAKIMAMLVDENSWLAACDKEDPGFVNACAIPNARQGLCST